jgi:tetratricopeptide (TPR) repeat protein
LLLCTLIITCIVIFSSNKFKSEKVANPVIKLAYIPIKKLDARNEVSSEYIKLNDNIAFDFTELTHVTTEKFEGWVEIEYPKLSSTYPFILTGKFRIHQQQIYLDFTLKGPTSDWEGQLSSSSMKDVTLQLQEHLRQQVIYDLIGNIQPPEVRQAKLSIAHQTSPNDLIILRELSISYFMTNELEKAMAMADKLIHLAQNLNMPQQLGRALAYQSKILTKKKLYDLSAKKLKLAMEQFKKINDLKYLSRAWYYQSWLDDQQKNYVALKASLLKSAQLAFEAQNRSGEIDTLIHLAGKAHTYQENEDKYYYLQQAEQKIRTYQLPSYRLAAIFYRYATFAKALSEKEPHLKQVLKLTELTPENWVAQSSRRRLIQNYLNQGRLDDAQELIDQTTSDNGNNSYLKTLMAQEKQHTDEMISQAHRTFEQAQLAGDRSLSLDIALILCSHDVNSDFYSQYISDNATEYWRNANENKLLVLNL